jgi:hypothetical protein
MKDGMRSEVRLLPLMLGKVVGGILTVIGFGGLVFISTRLPEPAVFSIALYVIAGIAVFIVCARIMSSRADNRVPETARKRTSGSKVLPWVILLALAVIVIVITLLISP